MKKSLKLWQIAGFIFTGISGVLLHFLYDWSNQSLAFAPFSAVNESIWEHMKLLFFPMFVFAFIENRLIGKKFKNFWSSKLAGILVGLIAIPLIYYTYTGIFGVNADWFNIVIYYIAAGISYCIETVLLNNKTVFCKSELIAFSALCLLAILFVVLTFVQPEIPLFKDPVTGDYGI